MTAALGAGCLGRQASQPAVRPEPKPAAAALPLWSVSSATAKVFLMGSVHLAEPSLFPLDSQIEAAFAASDVLWVEVEPRALEMASRVLVQRGLLPADESLEQLVSPGQFSRLMEAARSVGLKPAEVERMRPWLAGLALTVAQLEALGYSSEYGVDRYFMSGARKRALPVRGLEEAEQQVDLLASMDPELQRSFLEEALQETSSMGVTMRSIFSAWRVGDGDALDALVLRPLREASPQLFDRVFTQRNAAMTRQARTLLTRSGCAFVVVGAGHLVGPEGIVARLGAAGLPVVQHRPGDFVEGRLLRDCAELRAGASAEQTRHSGRGGPKRAAPGARAVRSRLARGLPVVQRSPSLRLREAAHR